MSELIESMKKALADSFAFYLKAANFHWNVQGSDFFQFHLMFGEIYSEVYDSIDSTAEHIRALGSYAPGSFGRFSELTVIKDENTIPNGLEMVRRLHADNAKVIETLKHTQALAEEAKEVGVGNYLQDRIDIHQKHAWKLRATIGTDSE